MKTSSNKSLNAFNYLTNYNQMINSKTNNKIPIKNNKGNSNNRPSKKKKSRKIKKIMKTKKN